jgi:hypothetical protein
MKRHIKLDSDAWNAFAGVATASYLKRGIKSGINHDFVLGLPVFFFENQAEFDAVNPGGNSLIHTILVALCWRIDGPAVRRSYFPTWTWLGWRLPGPESHWTIDIPLADLRKKPILDLLGPKCAVKVTFEGWFGWTRTCEWETYSFVIKHSLVHSVEHPLKLILTGSVFKLMVTQRLEAATFEEPTWIDKTGNTTDITRHAELLSGNVKGPRYNFLGIVMCYYEHILYTLVLQRSSETSDVYERAGFMWIKPRDDLQVTASKDGVVSVGPNELEQRSVVIL